MIIDGKYISGPYFVNYIEERDFYKISINDNVVDYIATEFNEESQIKASHFKQNLYADYYEHAKNVGWKDATESLKKKIQSLDNCYGIDTSGIKFNSLTKSGKEGLKINLPFSNENIEIVSMPSDKEKTYYLSPLVARMFRDWTNNLEKEGHEKRHEKLIFFLDDQIKQGMIEKYQIGEGQNGFSKEFISEMPEKLREAYLQSMDANKNVKRTKIYLLKVKYSHLDGWSNIEGAVAPEPKEKRSYSRSEEMLESRINRYIKALKADELIVFENSMLLIVLSDAKKVICDLQNIILNKLDARDTPKNIMDYLNNNAKIISNEITYEYSSRICNNFVVD